MNRIRVKHLSEREIEELQLDSWFPWSCDASTFNWSYDQTEECFLYHGHVKVWTSDKAYTEIRAGDFVVFPKGLTCKWEVISPVEKVYRFIDE